MTTAPAADRDTWDLLAEFGSATVYEASGLPCDLPAAFRPAWPGARCVGRALPVTAASGDNLPLHWAVAEAEPGDVLVVDAGGSEHGYWGEVLAVSAQARGIAGLVIDGGVRDVARLAALDFPTFSTCVAIRGTTKQWPGRVGTPVSLRGRQVCRGDIVVADADGIAVVPKDALARVAQAAQERTDKETVVMAELRAGALTLDLYGWRPLGQPDGAVPKRAGDR